MQTLTFVLTYKGQGRQISAPVRAAESDGEVQVTVASLSDGVGKKKKGRTKMTLFGCEIAPKQ